ncbi:MAG: nucleotide exchange factor GrpE [Planctomycetota bacterium]
MTAFGRKKSAESEAQTDVEAPDGATVEDAPEVDEVDAARAALADAEERALRAQADYQNLRRRTQSDIEAAVSRAKSDVLAEALTVLDYLDMALAAPVESEDAKNLKIGIEMTRGQLQGLFDRLSVRPIDAEGTFDPALHQAVSTVETEEHEPGTIVEVVRKGWMLGEDVLRFAQVRVAAAPDADENDDETDLVDVALAAAALGSGEGEPDDENDDDTDSDDDDASDDDD